MEIQLPCILTRGNIVQVSVNTVHSYTTLEKKISEAEERERKIVVAPNGDLYMFTPNQAEIIVEGTRNE